MKWNRPLFVLACSLLMGGNHSVFAQDTTGITASTAAPTDTGAAHHADKDTKEQTAAPQQKGEKTLPRAAKHHQAMKRLPMTHEQWQSMTLDQREQWQRTHPGEAERMTAHKSTSHAHHHAPSADKQPTAAIGNTGNK